MVDSRENISSRMKAVERDVQPLPADIKRDDSTGIKGLLSTGADIYENMPLQDKVALLTAPIPIVGDIAGGVADVMAIKEDPSALNISLALAGLLPFVPSAGVTRTLRQAMPQLPNDLPGFYSDLYGSKLGSAAIGGAKGLKNLIEARYSPKARALFKEEGISVADTKAAKKALKEFQDPEIGTEAGKKAIGQFRQSILFGEQYKDPSKFHKISEGLDEVAFGNLNANEYTKILGGTTGLTKKDFNSVFNEIKKIQNVDPNKNYQMTVRRTNTQAAGNLDQYVFSRPIFGGSTLNNLKKNVFKGKKFKTNKDFLKALNENKIKVRNPDEILKGQPAIVTGSVKSDAYELGGVNYMTAIKKDGNLISFMNDENDLFKLKLPNADRMLSISTPITVDILKKENKVKRLSPKVSSSQKNLKEAKNIKSKEVEKKLSKYPGVDTTLKTPQGMTKAQFYAVQAVANMKPSNPDYSRLLKEVGLAAPLRASKPLAREEENRKRGGSVIERNPYNYQPRAI